jgi:hypothetical protein
MITCDRCGCETPSSHMSYFNTDTICPACDEKERAHPKYQEAKRAEIAACKRGDFNFPGIGKPSDL